MRRYNYENLKRIGEKSKGCSKTRSNDVIIVRVDAILLIVIVVVVVVEVVLVVTVII
jgi:hypothetical protein